MNYVLQDDCLKQINSIVEKYPDYHSGIYVHVLNSFYFIYQGDVLCQKTLISGKDLIIKGIIPLGFKKWGILAKNVFEFFGIKSETDIGNIVSRLIEFKILKQNINKSVFSFEKINWRNALKNFHE